MPYHWELQHTDDGKDLGRVQLLIPYPATDNTPESANAAVIAKMLPDNVTVKEVSDQVYKKPFEGLTVVNDIPDGANWRTIVWTAKAGVQYVSLNRFGVTNKISVGQGSRVDLDHRS